MGVTTCKTIRKDMLCNWGILHSSHWNVHCTEFTNCDDTWSEHKATGTKHQSWIEKHTCTAMPKSEPDYPEWSDGITQKHHTEPPLSNLCTNWQQLDALLKNPVALKLLVWSRGLLVTLQILTCSSNSQVDSTSSEETHGSSGQCVSFSLIDVGSGSNA